MGGGSGGVRMQSCKLQGFHMKCLNETQTDFCSFLYSLFPRATFINSFYFYAMNN